MEEYSDRLETLERQLAELRAGPRSGPRVRNSWRALSIALAGIALTTVLLRPSVARGSGNRLPPRVTALEAQVATLKQQLDAERDARIAADTALTNALTAETTNRQAAGTALQNSLNAEIAARQAADTTQQSALSTETSARQAADTTVQNSLNAEIAARQAADTTQQSALSTETAARQAAVTALQAALSTEASARTAGNAVLQNQLDPLNFILAPFSRVGDNVIISGANLNVNNGLGGTETVNGLGNVIIGYNEGTPGYHQRTGSHNLVVGKGHHYTSFGGMVVGLNNGIFSDYAVVSGGQGNTASGSYSAVSGGALNRALGINSSVTGGNGNTAAYVETTVTGGLGNTANGHASTVSGGHLRSSPYQYDWVAGALYQND